MNNAKILFIVEGEKSEKILYRHIGRSFGLQANAFSVCGNIHMLYKKLKDMDFNADIIDVLVSLKGTSEEDKRMLKSEGPFAYIYLLFDFDPQHYDISKKGSIEKGLNEVEEMVNYFDNETDPTIGKLYINYPMFESFRDCDLKSITSFRERYISLDQCSFYKEIVGRRGFKINITKLDRGSLSFLITQNIKKANFIITKQYTKPSFLEYAKNLSQKEILIAEKNKVLSKSQVSVLHSGFFFLPDFLGKTFFDELDT